MKKINALTELCKTLDEKKKITMKNEIELTREEVGYYIKKDRDKYLQLKAELESEPSTTEACSYIFSLLGFAVAALAFIFSVASVGDKNVAAILVMIGMIVEIGIALRMIRNINPISRWRKYILAVIDEFDLKEFSGDNMKSN